MHFKTVRGPGVDSAKFRDFKIRSVDGFGLAEKASCLTVFWGCYSRFREKSLRALPQRERRKKGSRQLFDKISGLRGEREYIYIYIIYTHTPWKINRPSGVRLVFRACAVLPYST